MENNSVADKNEMSPKEMILQVKSFISACLGSWKTILLFVFPFVGYQLWNRFAKPVYYPTRLTFMVNDAKGSSVGGMLGQLAGLGGNDVDKMDKILELAKSRRTMSNALLQSVVLGGINDYYGNHLIKDQGLDLAWQKDTILSQFRFTHHNTDSFTKNEHRAVYALHKILIGDENIKPIFSTSVNKKTGIMVFNLKTNSEELSIQFIKQVFRSLASYYIESTVRKERESFEVLSAKKDSVERVLYSNDVSSAMHDDRHNNLLFQADKVPAKRFSRNNAVLTGLYTELVKNTALAEFALKTATPFITAIDEPVPPIKHKRYGSIRDILTYLFLGLLSGSIFVILRKMYRDIMREK
jgi:hypothetical protein